MEDTGRWGELRACLKRSSKSHPMLAWFLGMAVGLSLAYIVCGLFLIAPESFALVFAAVFSCLVVCGVVSYFLKGRGEFWKRLNLVFDTHPFWASLLAYSLLSVGFFFFSTFAPWVLKLAVMTLFLLALTLGVVICILGRWRKPFETSSGCIFLAFLLFVAAPLTVLGWFGMVATWMMYFRQ